MATRKAAPRKSSAASRKADATARRQRAIQKPIDARDARKPAKKTAKKATQAGPRKQPVQMPAQHLAKPGREADLDLAPRFEAPGYKGSGKLKGMTAIVTGADSGIGRAVAVLFAREGADVAIFYLNEHKDAKETARWVEKEGRTAMLVPGDVRDPAFCDKAVARVVRKFGRLDVLVNNAGFQLHADKLEDISDAHLQDCLLYTSPSPRD